MRAGRRHSRQPSGCDARAGVRARVQRTRRPGAEAVLESRVERFADGSFVEDGTWRITGGAGHLAGATGVITSNFTVSTDGDVIDDQFARIYLP